MEVLTQEQLSRKSERDCFVGSVVRSDAAIEISLLSRGIKGAVSLHFQRSARSSQSRKCCVVNLEASSYNCNAQCDITSFSYVNDNYARDGEHKNQETC